jgi:chemotaxis protein MotB
MAKKKAEAHHGGAWKVAYADFVTAMMALFMVLWICAQDEEVLLATSRYFQSPFESPLSSRSGLLDFEASQPISSSGRDDNSGESPAAATSAATIDLQFLNTVAQDFYRLLNLDESMADHPVDVQVTSDGLRVTLFDRASRPLFGDQSAELTSWGEFVMQSVAWLIDRNDFNVVIEGHTRRGLELSKLSYSEWELSADRANSSRRALVRFAVRPSLIERVSGYADTRPIPLVDPTDESNQRVTLSLRLGNRPETPEPAVLPPSSETVAAHGP